MLLTRCMLKVEDKKKGEGGRKMVQKFLSERKNQESEIHQMATVGNLVEKTSRVWGFFTVGCIFAFLRFLWISLPLFLRSTLCELG